MAKVKLPSNARLSDFNIEVTNGDVCLTIEYKDGKVSILNKAGTTDFGFVRKVSHLKENKLQVWKDVVMTMQQCVDLIEQIQDGNISENIKI